MGFSVSWLAVDGTDKGSVLATLGLDDTGEAVGTFSSDLAVAELPNGWVLVTSTRLDDCLADRWLSAVSEFGPVIACQLSENVMFSRAVGYEDGAMVWTVQHDAEHGIWNLDSDGRLPAQFEEIRRRLSEEQEREGGEDADVDLLFDVPVELARTLAGFRYDQADEPAFTRVVRQGGGKGGQTSGRGFLARLFGRR